MFGKYYEARTIIESIPDKIWNQMQECEREAIETCVEACKKLEQIEITKSLEHNNDYIYDSDYISKQDLFNLLYEKSGSNLAFRVRSIINNKDLFTKNIDDIFNKIRLDDK